MKRIFASGLLLLCLEVFAARPFVTDDARLTSTESCQIESWSRLYKNSSEIWALPACNLTGNFEVTAGSGQSRTSDVGNNSDYVVQGKTLFRQLTSNGWGWGLVVGRINHPDISPGPNLYGNTYAYIPISISTNNDQVIYHANVGRLRDKGTREIKSTYGIGAEIQLTSRFLYIAEVFGDNKARPYWQTGARYSVIPNLFQVDATIGQQINGDSATRWISFGIRYTPDKIF